MDLIPWHASFFLLGVWIRPQWFRRSVPEARAQIWILTIHHQRHRWTTRPPMTMRQPMESRCPTPMTLPGRSHLRPAPSRGVQHHTGRCG